jgi:aminoglycoside phosphotransferase (APT) family kinase protein
MLVDVETAGVSPSDALLESLAQYLGSYAPAWFDIPGASRVRYLRTQVRRNATLYYFDAQSEGESHSIVVKVPFGRRHSGKGARNAQKTLPDELRILPISTSGLRGPLEYATLSRIDQTFGSGQDKRFGAIRILDYLPEAEALVMGYCPDQNLDDLFVRRSRLYRYKGAQRIEEPVRNAGAWLRRYHELPALPETVDRAPLRADFLASIDRFTGYLLETGGESTLVEHTRETILRAAATSLPERLPLVTNHGDFVPRNILVGDGGRVTVFDTRAQWRAPVYEDIVRFLVALSASELQMLGLGWMYSGSELADYESAFLQGYFGADEIPLLAIRLFECQRLLAIWVASAYQSAIAGGLRGIRKTLVLGLRRRHLRKRIQSILGVLEGDG